MKYQEIYTLTRPSVDVPFHNTDSIFYYDPADPTFSSPLWEYFVNTYINTGKASSEKASVLSDDGLVMTYTTIFNTSESIGEVLADPYINNGYEARQEWYNDHGIQTDSTISPIEE
jgi:hypothetical protein